MDSKTLYQLLQSKYSLANYVDVFKIWLQNKKISLAPYDEQIYSIVARAYLLLKGKEIPGMEEEIKENNQIQQRLKLFKTYLFPLLNSQNTNENSLKELIQEFYYSKFEMNYSIALIEDYLCYETNDYKKFIQNEASFKQFQELHLFTFFIYLKMNRPDLTEKQLKILKEIDDEDVCTHLANLYYLIQIGNYTEAIIEIENLKEQYSEWTTKLINLKAFCLLHSKQFAEAKQLLLNLQKLMLSQSSLRDQNELEICLTNLIIVSNILGEDDKTYLQELENLNSQAFYFQKKRSAIEKIDQAINSMSSQD